MSKPIGDLINEARLFYQSLVQVTESLHGTDSISVGMRAVMEFLLLNGEETVPNIARLRRVTRQRIQTLANQLLDLGLVEVIENPATKRSPLIALTLKGKQQIDSMRRRETELVGAITTSESRLRTATRVLQEVRAGLEEADGVVTKAPGRNEKGH